MRIDPKYFNIVVGSAGVFAIILIGLFTISHFTGQQVEFREEIGDGSEIREFQFETFAEGDTLSIADFAGQPVVLDFWATWSHRSQYPHQQLDEVKQQHQELVVISAMVKDDEANLRSYLQDVEYDFIFVDGTDAYQDFLVPGIPTYLFFDREGELIDIIIGSRNIDDFAILTTYLEEQ